VQPVLEVVRRDERLVAQVSLSAPKPGAPDPSVVIEVTRAGGTAPALRLPTRAGRLGPGTRRLAQETVPVALLPAGKYTVAAIVGSGGPTLTRVVSIEAGNAPAAEPSETTNTASPAASATSPALPAPLTLAKPARFEVAAVLDPARVAPFLDKLVDRVADPSARDALARARSGSWPTDTSTGPLAAEPVASHFVAGLGRLQAGDLEGAANDFRSALRAAPDFAPAMAYLGACYAAGGKDKEAAAAWQTALVRERETPWLQQLAIEAWLRAERPGAALALIKQARQRFPGDDSFLQLQARAAVADGRAREGLEMIETIKNADESLLLMALATLYSPARERAPVWDASRDLETMKRWREAYAAANGASLALVDAWLAELSASP
jgi:hypothetical protein